eukprot:ANDGO_01824.mRNA.1 hypothetical protein
MRKRVIDSDEAVESDCSARSSPKQARLATPVSRRTNQSPSSPTPHQKRKSRVNDKYDRFARLANGADDFEYDDDIETHSDVSDVDLQQHSHGSGIGSDDDGFFKSSKQHAPKTKQKRKGKEAVAAPTATTNTSTERQRHVQREASSKTVPKTVAPVDKSQGKERKAATVRSNISAFFPKQAEIAAIVVLPAGSAPRNDAWKQTRLEHLGSSSSSTSTFTSTSTSTFSGNGNGNSHAHAYMDVSNALDHALGNSVHGSRNSSVGNGGAAVKRNADGTVDLNALMRPLRARDFVESHSVQRRNLLQADDCLFLSLLEEQERKMREQEMEIDPADEIDPGHGRDDDIAFEGDADVFAFSFQLQQHVSLQSASPCKAKVSPADFAPCPDDSAVVVESAVTDRSNRKRRTPSSKRTADISSHSSPTVVQSQGQQSRSRRRGMVDCPFCGVLLQPGEHAEEHVADCMLLLPTSTSIYASTSTSASTSSHSKSGNGHSGAQKTGKGTPTSKRSPPRVTAALDDDDDDDDDDGDDDVDGEQRDRRRKIRRRKEQQITQRLATASSKDIVQIIRRTSYLQSKIPSEDAAFVADAVGRAGAKLWEHDVARGWVGPGLH